MKNTQFIFAILIACMTLNVFSVKALDVAIMASPSTSTWNDDVQTKLQNTGFFNTVDVYDTTEVIPSVEEMNSYCAVLAYSDNFSFDDEILGDNLADYVDTGAGVVTAVFANEATWTGRFNGDNYWAINPTGLSNSETQETLGEIFDVENVILDGVLSFDGGTSSYRPSSTDIHEDATVVANWSDGTPLIVTRLIGEARRVDLGFYPPSSDVRGDFWDASTEGNVLLANALVWACHPASLDITPSSQEFGEVNLGDTLIETFTVHNSGRINADVTEIHLNGDDNFTLNTSPLNSPCGDTPSLAYDESCTVEVSFTPTSVEDFSTSLLVESNDSENPILSVSLLGIGVSPAISVTPSVADFVDTVMGESASQIFTISNVGSADLTVTAINLDDEDNFTLNTSTDSLPCEDTPTLSPEETCEIEVIFNPLALGDYATSLIVSSNDSANDPLSLALTGSAIADAGEDDVGDDDTGDDDTGTSSGGSCALNVNSKHLDYGIMTLFLIFPIVIRYRTLKLQGYHQSKKNPCFTE